MVYIYKKIVGGKSYYYLRVSERKGKKVISKDVAYLGDAINEVKKNLHNLAHYREQIRKSYKKINSFLESNHFLEKAQKLNLKQDKYIKAKTDEVEACKIHYSDVFNKEVLDKVYKITTNDNLGNTTTNTYTYEGGKYYFIYSSRKNNPGNNTGVWI